MSLPSSDNLSPEKLQLLVAGHRLVLKVIVEPQRKGRMAGGWGGSR